MTYDLFPAFVPQVCVSLCLSFSLYPSSTRGALSSGIHIHNPHRQPGCPPAPESPSECFPESRVRWTPYGTSSTRGARSSGSRPSRWRRCGTTARTWSGRLAR